MAEQIIKMRIQFRRDIAANWEQFKDTVPVAGEPCFITDKNILKIGDGVTTFENLESINGAKLSADEKSIVLADGVFKLAGFDAAEIGAQPRKNADGNIEWVVPSTEALDKLQSAVVGIESDVKTIQEVLGTSATGGDTIMNRVVALEDQVGILNGDETIEGSILKIVKDEIDDFASKVSDDGVFNTVKEFIDYVSAHGGETQKIVSDITSLQALVGTRTVGEQIAEAVINSGHITINEAFDTFLSKREANSTLKRVKYEITNKPVGTLVDYREKEIRVMCPADTKWVKQTVGATGNANMYYMGFKAYAPDGAVSFKEGDQGTLVDTVFTFDDDFAGVDEFGRKYSICWLALASYNTSTDTWTYFGKNSSAKKYVGWTYVVEWYDANGTVIESDSIRINLSNESCHNVIEPYYMANVVKEVSIGDTVLDVINNRIELPAGAGLKSSDEIEIAEDGTVHIKTISFDKIAQSDNGNIVFDGGGAAG